MSEPLVLESATGASAILTRRDVAGLVRLIGDEGHGADGRWNVVEALEILMDAGHYVAALDLAERIATLAGSARGRLFEGYAALCRMIISGEFSTGIQFLEHRRAEILHGQHSAADKIRIGILFARSLVMGVAMGCSAESAMARARGILGVEHDRALQAGNAELSCVTALEVAKTHLWASEPDMLSARAILQNLSTANWLLDAKPETIFDVRRFLYHVEGGLPDNATSVAADMLREEGAALGDVNAALAELSIIRRGPSKNGLEDGMLAGIEQQLAEGHFVGAAFEAAYKRASSALHSQHYARAERAYASALKHAEAGGFLHGTIVSRMGLFQCAVATGDPERTRALVDTLARRASSELATGVAGLSIVAALQVTGDYSRAAKLARSCERFFRVRGLTDLESQASFVEGACHAGEHRWKEARLAWQRALKLDDDRGAIVSASDRRGAVAQAIAMHEFSLSGSLPAPVFASAERLLLDGEEKLSKLPVTPDTSRVLGKLLQIHAQLCIMTQKPVDGLRHLGRAREVYLALGNARETAIIDGLSGLALLEVAKTRSPQMFDEASQALQRALDYFSGTEHIGVRWKLKYYLSVAAYLSSQAKTIEFERAHRRSIAAGWLHEAEKDSMLLRSGEVRGAPAGVECDFSPGLNPEALEPLKKALGVEPVKIKEKSSRSSRAATRSRRPSRQLH